MFSLVTLFSLMMSPAIIVLIISFIVSAFESKSSVLTGCDSSSLVNFNLA
ncbi:hypothetical protein tinsulaeT_13890 [Thalassotalea insulae]|uniref:Uncharacterized protein n=1 Tax=Thalassotalea insulae TaxID=2056778 RepID=A0ABQ6GRS6_9GAMM|nr:hypothetical protein [Thalassotalea insulae]GLX78049.1 hypothetical protein tinsulaeT_13890 [Thalassotalea insulae]